MGREEVHSEGGCTSYKQILGASAIDDMPASEQLISMCFWIVGDGTGLPGVTVESICSGEIDSRHWMGEQWAVVATPRKRQPRV